MSSLDIEEVNDHDRYAISVIVGEKIIGHVPWEISKTVIHVVVTKAARSTDVGTVAGMDEYAGGTDVDIGIQ